MKNDCNDVLKEPFSTEIEFHPIYGRFTLANKKNIPSTLESFELPEESHYLIESEHYRVQKDLWQVMNLEAEFQSELVASYLLALTPEQRQVLKDELSYSFSFLLYVKEPSVVIAALQNFLDEQAKTPFQILHTLKSQIKTLIDNQAEVRYKVATNLRWVRENEKLAPVPVELYEQKWQWLNTK